MAVSMVANERNNSLLVRAGPDKMAVIAQVVEHVDIPVSHDDSLLVNLNRMQVYRLAGIDPEPVVKTLMEIGNLDPATRLEVDKKNSAVIAYAPLSDHVTIRAVVDKLVGSERKFEVIRLHRLAADYVAGTIDFMMGSGKKEKTRSSPYYFSNDSSRREAGENSKEFHVEADVEHNRLLLWANPVELTAVEALLAKLGEIPASGNGSGNIRVIDGGDARQTQELIERIRRAWPSIAPNALEGPAADSPLDGSKEPIPRLSPPPKDLPTSLPSPSPSPSPLPSSAAGQAQAALLLIDVPRPPAAGTAEERAVDERAAGDRTAGERTAADSRPAPPPVKITVGPDGKLIVTSQDGLALDRLEELAAQLAIPRKDFHVFHLKYASAFGVSLNLEDFFKEEKKQPARMMPWWYNDSDSQNDADSERRLSKRRKLTFISDTDSNTILVEGASAEQLKTIEDLIQVYDQPPPRDTQSARRTEVIRLKYSKAKALADTVKDVYRDLLSPDDKALAVNNQGRETRRTIIFDNGDSDNKEQKTPKFKGLLSIGVDEISNSLTISAPAYLFEHVTRLINELDQAAAPDYTVRMVRVDGMSASRVKELVDRVYNQKSGENPPAEERPAKKPAAPAKKLSSRAGRGAGEAGSEGTEEAH
jgi:type II secretory pathway component GspD/PulD (secretin)